MIEVLTWKFEQYPELRTLLLGTGDADLVYGDEWDDYWGSGSKGDGDNELGKALMKIRKSIRKEMLQI